MDTNIFSATIHTRGEHVEINWIPVSGVALRSIALETLTAFQRGLIFAKLK